MQRIELTNAISNFTKITRKTVNILVKCKIIFISISPQEIEDIVKEWLGEHPNIDVKAVSMQPNWAFAIFYEEK